MMSRKRTHSLLLVLASVVVLGCQNKASVQATTSTTSTTSTTLPIRDDLSFEAGRDLIFQALEATNYFESGFELCGIGLGVDDQGSDVVVLTVGPPNGAEFATVQQKTAIEAEVAEILDPQIFDIEMSKCSNTVPVIGR